MRKLCRLLGLLLLFPGVVAVAEERPAPVEADYYPITDIPIPEGVVLEPGAFELMPDGRLAAGSRRGEIWMIADPLAEQPTEDQFSRYAHGFHEILGLSAHDGTLFVTHRPEITRVEDTDGDGTVDVFETLSAGWGISGDYHEYAFGSDVDAAGNQWVVLCLTGSFSSKVPFRGWCVRITPDGVMIPTTSGLRSPGGIGFDASGNVFYTDNQGPWNGTCSLKPLIPGTFVGHPGGNQWYELASETMGPRPEEPESGSRIVTEAARIPQLVPPAILFPYKKMGQSASGIACDTTGGKFGPFAGQLFVADQTHSTVMRCDVEQVQGVFQGACFPFREGFDSGGVALEMAPQGALFVGGTSRGWGSRGTRPYSIERLDWTGKTPFEILHMRVRPGGFRLTFTKPVDPQTAGDPASYETETYTYIYQASYGSPEVDHTYPTITSAEVAADGRAVDLVIDGLKLGHVHELHVPGVRSADGERLLHDVAYYTLNALSPD